jgi:hypothetical protein
VHADQAIFTSLERRGKAGYHLVARSTGVSESEAAALVRWCPSHGALIVDEGNSASVNFHPLASGRFVLARTVMGRPEFSGRGGRQVYTHALLLDLDAVRTSGYRPFLIYRDALALGHLHYRPEPPVTLPRVELCSFFPKRTAGTTSAIGRALGLPVFDSVLAQLNAGQHVVLPFDGDRAALAETLIDQLEPETVLATSFATSLSPSSMRPFVLHVVAPAGRESAAATGIPARSI